jgi:uncharacterized membrane protein YvlD (DUF360 family)
MDLLLNNWSLNLMTSGYADLLAVTKAAKGSPIIGVIISLVVMAIAFYAISFLPIGIQITSPQIALISAAVFSFLNLFTQWFENFLNKTFIGAPLALVINMAIFGLTAAMIDGFELKGNKLLSAFLGSLALTFVGSILAFALKGTPYMVKF